MVGSVIDLIVTGIVKDAGERVPLDTSTVKRYVKSEAASRPEASVTSAVDGIAIADPSTLDRQAMSMWPSNTTHDHA
jgi:hypothetical protein